MNENKKTFDTFPFFSFEDRNKWIRTVSDKMGAAFHFLSAAYGIPVEKSIEVIREGGYWKCWEYLHPYSLLGKTGGEIAYDIAETVGRVPGHKVPLSYSAEYWIGWFITQLMYRGGLSFLEIFEYISPDELKAMYGAYHQMDADKGIKEIRDRISERREERISQFNL